MGLDSTTKADSPGPERAGADPGQLDLGQVFAAFPNLFFLIGPDDRYLDYRAGGAAAPYVPPEHFLGRTVAEIMPPDVVAPVLDGVRRARTSRALVTVDYALPMPGGVAHYQAQLIGLPDGRVVCRVDDVTPHKVAEETLRRQQTQIRRLLSLSPSVIYALRVEGGRIVPASVSENVTRVVGYTPPEVIAPGFWEAHVHPDDLPAAKAALDRLLRGGHQVSDYRFLHRDGSWRWLRDEMRLERGEAGRPDEIVGAWNDVTEAKQAEATRRLNEERLRAIIETEPECVKVVGPDGYLREMNPSGLAMLEAGSLEEAREKPLLEYVAAEHRPAFRDLFARVMQGGTGSLAFEVVGLGGRRRWLETSATPLRDPDGRVTALLGVTRDITGHRRAQEALQRSEERFRALIERSPSLVAVVDAGRMFSFCSPAVAGFLGYAPEEMVGKEALGFVHPDDVPKAAAALEEVARRGGGSPRIELRHPHRDGSIRRTESVLTNLLHEPAVQGIVINARDITEQRRLEEQFHQAQRLEGIGRLAGGVAHDFNNLLTVVLGSAEYLAEGIRAGAPRIEDVDAIRTAGERARDLTAQLLAVARRQVTAPVPLDLNEAVRDADKLLRRVLGEDIQIGTSLAPDVWPVRMDPAQLQQIILNLAVNSRDAMPEGGTLTIETANVVIGEVRSASQPGVGPGDYAMLAVSDSGAGMSAETRAHLFEPFFTTKAVGHGTGLGLATVYGIVKQGGGDISVASEPGKGSTFRIFLPRTTAPDAPPARPPSRPEAGGSETLLVVEDDASVRDLTVRTVRSGGYRILVAGSGPEALEMVGREPGPIHLLVTDVVMPAMNGRQLAEELTRRFPALRVLYLSGYTENTIRLHDPGTEFLAKPVASRVLLAKIREILDRPGKA